MKLSQLFIPVFLLSLASSLAATTVVKNFTAAEGFTEDGSLNNVSNWLAQTPWIAKDVNGAGYATNPTDFNRAVLFTNQAFNVGDTYTLVSELSLVDSSQVNTKTNMFMFGLTDVMSPGGGNKPKIGMTVRPAFLNYFIDANVDVGGQETNTGVAKDTLTSHTYKTVITKSATANTFDVSIDFDNGTASKSFTVVDSALYTAETLYPIIDSQGANSKGGIRLNSFSTTYEAAVVPECAHLTLLAGSFLFGYIIIRRRK
jgi:hypothetical protein